MDPELFKLLTQLGIHGPTGAIIILLIWLLIQERKRVIEERRNSAELTAKLLELAKATVQAEGEHNQAYEALGNLYELGTHAAAMNAKVISSLEMMSKGVGDLETEVRRNYDRPKGR